MTLSPFCLFQFKNIDYFARLKQSMMSTPTEKMFAGSKMGQPTVEDDDYYEVKKAPMMMLLPGSRPSLDTPPTTPKKLSDAISVSAKETETEEESEYTYETEEEEEEEEVGSEVGQNGTAVFPVDCESYEIKAERVLEEQMRERVSVAPELDYIDEEDEEVQPQVYSAILNYAYLKTYFFY